MLRCENLVVRRGSAEVLHGLSLEVREGEVVALIGANGAGKTTTLMAIAGAIAPGAGRVVFRGEEVAGLPSHTLVEKGISLVPEGRRIFPRLTVAENLAMGAYVRRDAGVAADEEKVYDLFPILRDRRRQLGGTLSGGEQQMLAIGRALMARPRLLLLDEPSLGLAPRVVETIFRVLRDLRDRGTTILLVEQNARAALRLAARAYVLETGRIALTGTGRELLDDPAVKAAYLGG